MECFNHPEKNAVAICQACGRALCKECQNVLEGHILCSSCLKETPSHWFNFHMGFPGLGKFIRDIVYFSYPCPECGRPIKHDFKVCPYCKAELKLVCPKCDRRMEPGWIVCPYCGERTKDNKK